MRVEPEDFRVTEVPLVSPCGEGEHSWLYVQKRNSNTQWVARQLARHAGVGPAKVSYAGLKDRRAVTEQWFSVHLPGRAEPDWAALACDEFRVLSASRHQRKLKTGTLKGNRFELRIREVQADPALIEQRLRQIETGGLANYFGPQRFGHDGDNLSAAAAMFAAPKQRLPRAKRSIYLSAVRSALFNRVLSARVEQGVWNDLILGDALQLEGKSACFVAQTDDSETRQRLLDHTVHPTGPLCGDGESLCSGDALAFENNALAPYQDWIDALRSARVAASRRALRVMPRDLQGRREADDCWVLEFFLPAGCYATSLLAEILQVSESA